MIRYLNADCHLRMLIWEKVSKIISSNNVNNTIIHPQITKKNAVIHKHSVFLHLKTEHFFFSPFQKIVQLEFRHLCLSEGISFGTRASFPIRKAILKKHIEFWLSKGSVRWYDF